MYEEPHDKPLTLISQRFLDAYYVIAKKPRGPSKAQFSAAVGISASNWSKYERGVRPFDLTSVVALMTTYRVSPNYLLFGDGEMFSSPEQSNSTSAHIANNSGNAIGTNTGKATQQQGSEAATLALAHREVEFLREQLKMQDAVIAAKDQTIAALLGRPTPTP